MVSHASRFRYAWLTIPVIAALGACGDDSRAATIEIRDAWARATPPGATTGAVYMTVRSAADDTLVGAAVDPSVAAGASTHQTVSSGGQLSMSHAAGIALPAGDDVSFEPGAYHVMLEELTAPLLAGQSFALTLDFERAPDVTVSVGVHEDAP